MATMQASFNFRIADKAEKLIRLPKAQLSAPPILTNSLG